VTPPRVLLIEDDASIRHFVELALEDEGVELRQAATIADGLQQLQSHGPFRLIVTDLMLPDGHGQEILRALIDVPRLRGGARVAVFSAGLSAETRQQLGQLGVDEIISKPAPLAQLLACVQQALAQPTTAPDATDGAAAAAVERYVAGNQPLFDAYCQSCRRQFALDRRAGDAALAAGDLPGIRRLAHSLKTVLLTLGQDAASETAQQLERDAADGKADAARTAWQRLGQALDALVAE
jgi:DNA-binding response OmpR family regulator